MAHDPPDGPARGEEEPGRDGAPQGPLVEMARYAGHGITLALATAAFALLGRWADARLSTAPLFVIVGAILGFAGGFYHMIRELVPGGLRGGPADRDASEGGNGGRGRTGVS
jgi:hypothetical protein